MKNSIIVTVGASSSGKTTFAKHMQHITGYPILSRDDIRARLQGLDTPDWTTWDITREQDVKAEHLSAIQSALNSGSPFIIADTHLSIKHVEAVINLIKPHTEFSVVFVMFDRPLELCLERNAKRGLSAIPVDAIESQCAAFRTMAAYVQGVCNYPNFSFIDYQ